MVYNGLMFREKIRESARRVVEMLGSYPDIADNELQTKISLIEPVLRSLGYDTTHPEQVTLEVATELGGRIDYMLTGETKATIAVEAKRAGMNLSDKETKQLRAYFTFSEAVSGILTNGVTYWLFTDLDKRNIMDLEPFRKIDIRNATENDLRHLEHLARSRVSKDRVHEQARQERYQAQINSIVAQELTEPSQDFLKLVGKKAGIKPLNKTNLEFLRPLVTESIRQNRSEKPPTDPTPEPPPSTPPQQGKQPNPNGAAKTKARFQGATLFGESLAVKTYAQTLAAVVTELQALHSDDFDNVVINRSKFRGRKYWMISRKEDDLAPYSRKVRIGGYRLDTNLSAQDIIKRSHLFLEAFGHKPADLVIHTKDDPTPA